MKNILFWVAFAVLVLGIVCLRYSYTRGSIENWEPVHLPFPGPGLVVAYPFRIESRGRFEVQLSVPMTDNNTLGGIPQKPPIKSNLMVKIKSLYEKNNFKNTQYIKEFSNYGGGGFSRTYFFTGATFELPRKGDYRIEIVNEDYDEVLDNCSRTGGMIRLMRYEKLETGLLYGLLHALAYVLITISIISMIIIRILENLKNDFSKTIL